MPCDDDVKGARMPGAARVDELEVVQVREDDALSGRRAGLTGR
jgi:hypothetical protein